MPYYCTVPRCTSMAGKAKNVSFHQFPRDEELARLWNDILKRGKPYTKYSKVCSLHFKPEDYTITSVGKNKGQWRTLRKDAVPSQNLPSETPAPYSRKQWDSWSHTTPNVMDPSIHQQMAQAIYMQTMLAMQAAGATEPPNHHNGPIPEDIPHTSNQEKEDITSYKCTECTKCFKDPDVFILHKRTHSKKNGIEKENYNMNLTLRSNPILANLLKTNNEVNFDPNLATMESILMTALAANMDYLRNFSMIKEERDDRGELNHDRSEMNRDSVDLNRDRNELNHDGSEMNHDRADMNRDRREMNHDRVEMNHDSVDMNRDMREMNRGRCEMNHDRVELDHESTENLNRHSFLDDLTHLQNERTQTDKLDGFKSQNSFRKSPNNLNYPQGLKDDLNDPVIKGALNVKSDLNIKDDSNSDDDIQKEPIGLSYAMNFSTKIGKQDVYKSSYKNRFYDEKNSECNDLNESVDSDLVIDESV